MRRMSTTIGLTLHGVRSRTVDVDAETLFHTLTHDFSFADDGTTYVETGDIPAMWLRDSSAQTIPYIRFSSAYPQIDSLVRGVIQRNAKNVITSPYANAFTQGYKLWEEKWEVDSLAYSVDLSTVYWRDSHNPTMFTPRLHWAFKHIVQTYECEQQHRTCSGYRSRFLSNHGAGSDYAYTGMIWGAFRPSDDPVRYPYNIPQEMFAAQQLAALASLAEIGYNDKPLAMRAGALSQAIRQGIDRYGLFYDFRYGWIYAYEVDGRGNAEMMDDANLPDLLSGPLLGYLAEQDPLYRNTRRFSLSTDNPFFYRGRYAAGLGSPHTPTGWVWPLGMITQAMTASTAGEVAEGIEELRALDGARGLFYESVDPNRPWHYTRSEFGWANALYAELIFRSVARLAPASSAQAPLPQLLPTNAVTPVITTPVESWRAAATIYEALSSILAGETM